MNIRKQTKIWQAAIGCMSLALLQLNSAAVNAADFPLVDIAGEAAGTEIITAGKGLEGAKSVDINVINFTVPASNTIKQILLFWEGYTNVDQGIPTPGDSDIMVNGDPVSGDLLGGPVILGNSGELASYAYRADITNKVTPSAGAKAVAISALEFDLNNDGAGVMVILDDGTDEAEIAIREGNDFAYWKATGDLQVTGAQVFNDFTPSSEERTASLELMFASVEGGFSGGGERPSAIDVTIMGTTTEYNDLLNSVDGDEWDAITLPVTIPANASSLTVQAFSEDRAPVTGNDPASFHWLAAGLAIKPPPPPGGEGCTPGFYKNLKNDKHLKAWGGISPNDLFSDWFDDAFPDPDPGMKLKQVLRQGGGGLKALGRHTVAALLNANNGDVAYGMTTTQVINAFNDVFDDDNGTKKEYNAQKNIFAGFNELGCPINGKEWADNGYEFGPS